MESLGSVILLGALVLLLVSAGIEDARIREIADWKNGLIALLAPLWWWAHGLGLWPAVAIQLGLALGVFVVFYMVFLLNGMGGGDVKMLTAMALWLPLQPLGWMLAIMSLLGGVLTLLMVADAWWRRTGQRPEPPYGVAIAIAGLLILREPFF